MSEEQPVPSGFLASGRLDSALRRLGVDLIGTTIGSYQITSLLGIGGMGEVYRARDTTLGREVAIKVLPPEFTSDRDRLARFEREARLLATLNHPHIAAIYGFESGSGTPALVLELVDGETVGERLTTGAIPVSEALSIARQIAEALEAAHERGIIHRDLKPANIKITPDGNVKVVDFGLAKMTQPSDTLLQTSGLTHEGTIAGTAAYMSPEQARGKAVDKRADIWAFGCVLYEMLSGHPAFLDETVSDTIAGVLDREPAWGALPGHTPQSICGLLRRCLDKNQKRRLQDIGDARIEIEDALAPEHRDVSKEGSRYRSRRPVIVGLAAGIAIGVLASVTAVMLRPAATPTAEVFHLSIDTPPMQIAQSMAVSADGATIAYSARTGERPMLFVRRIGSLDSRPLAGTEHGLLPFWSPDNRSIGFWDSEHRKVKIVDVTGGPPRVVCDTPPAFYGGTWNSDDVIVFSTWVDDVAGLHRVSAMGGIPAVLRLKGPPGAADLRWPQFLPDGHRVLYHASGARLDQRALFVGSLNGGEPTMVMLSESNAAFVPPNQLLFTRNRALVAQRVDPETLATAGEALPVAQDILLQVTGRAAFSVANAGVLLYRSGEADRSLVWIDRSGNMSEPVGSLVSRNYVRLSPDGKRAAFHEPREGAAEEDVFVHDVDRAVTNRLTTAPGRDHVPIWSPDSSTVAWDVHRGDDRAIYARGADAAKPERLLVPSEAGVGLGALSWSADFFVFCKAKADSYCTEIWAQPLAGDRKAFRYVSRHVSEAGAVLSPNGRWLAYVADEGGVPQVIVQSFPDASQGRHVISSKGGSQPRWRRDGRELFFYSADRRLNAISVTTDGAFKVLKSTELFSAPEAIYDVAPDGQRFLFNVAATTLPNADPITVVLNWPGMLIRHGSP